MGSEMCIRDRNRTVPKQYTAESIEPAEAFRLLAEKRAAGPSKRGRRKTTGAAAKKTAAKKSSTASATKKTVTAKKTAAKKTTARKTAAKKTAE